MRFSRLTLDPVVSAPALTLVAVFVSLLIKPTLLYSIDCNGNKIDDAADIVPQNFGFPSPASYATGKGPAAVIAADFNGDGDIDVGTPNSASNDVSVLLNDGSGAFSAPKNFLVGVQPRAFAAADLDGDSHVDLAVANYGAFPDPSPAVSLLLNSGDGTFAETREVVAHGRQISIVAADFDGDSRPDLALTFLGTSNGATFVAPGISVLLNTGNGTFGAPLDLETGDFPSPLISGDFDGDGDMDLAVVSSFPSSTKLSLFLNHGNGTFAPGNNLAFQLGIVSIQASDLDRDGDLDLAALNLSSISDSSLSVLLNSGNGTFQPGASYPIARNAPGYGIGVADLDKDGAPDLAVTYGDGRVQVLLNRGDGVLRLDAIYQGGNGPVLVAPSDLDGDSDIDLAVASNWYSRVSALFNIGNGTFFTAVDFPAGPLPTAVTVGDFDNDGNPDMVVADADSRQLALLRYDGQGKFRAPEYVPDGIVGGGPVFVTSADLDIDGNLDLIALRFHSTKFWVIPGAGGGRFGPPVQFLGTENTGVSTLVATDLNGDGLVDLAAASCDVSVFLNEGGFFSEKTVFSGSCNSPSMAAGDLNGDGSNDLILAYDQNYVSLLFNNTDGTFDHPVRWHVTEQPFSIIAADLDGDSWLDLATANAESADVSILINRGDGGFKPAVEFPVGRAPESITAADLDGDGDLDIATADRDSNTVSVLRNNGDAVFGEPASFGVGSRPNFVLASDLDKDGKPDLAVVSDGIGLDGTVSLLFNQTVFPHSPDRNRNGIPDECEGILFHRGDPDADGQVTVTDAISVLVFLFRGGAAPQCKESADVNNDGGIDLADGITILNYLFLQGAPPAPPGPPPSPCGPDPDAPGSPADLGCKAYEPCKA